MPQHIDGILFDLDDTLYDRGAAFNRWLNSYIQDTLKVSEPKEIAAVLQSISVLDSGGYGSKKAVVEEVCRLYPAADGMSSDLGDFYDLFFGQLVLDCEAMALLDLLDNSGIPYGVVTNGLERQWRKIDKMGLRERTSCLFVSATFGCEKPDPAIFIAAANCLKIEPQSILFVGDHPINDILGAHKAGMQTAWIPRGKPWPQDCAVVPDRVIESLLELTAHLSL